MLFPISLNDCLWHIPTSIFSLSDNVNRSLSILSAPFSADSNRLPHYPFPYCKSKRNIFPLFDIINHRFNFSFKVSLHLSIIKAPAKNTTGAILVPSLKILVP
jgi:hypothetical protein